MASSTTRGSSRSGNDTLAGAGGTDRILPAPVGGARAARGASGRRRGAAGARRARGGVRLRRGDARRARPGPARDRPLAARAAGGLHRIGGGTVGRFSVPGGAGAPRPLTALGADSLARSRV